MIAYLDLSAFDHIYGKVGCSGADIANLRKAIYGRQLSIRLSLHGLEEILLRRATPQALAAQIKLTLSLANSRALLKPCAQLLLDDVRAYATRGGPDRPFLRGEMQNAVSNGIAALIESDGEELDDEFVAALEQARRQKELFFTMVQAVEKTRPVHRQSPGLPAERGQPAATAAHALNWLAERAAVGDACNQRGLEGLLSIRSVQMMIGVALWSDSSASPAPPAAGSDNLHHAVSAAAVAETFVTDHTAGRKLLQQIALDGFEIKSLPEFLAGLRA